MTLFIHNIRSLSKIARITFYDIIILFINRLNIFFCDSQQSLLIFFCFVLLLFISLRCNSSLTLTYNNDLFKDERYTLK